jgi:hypothetical protein
MARADSPAASEGSTSSDARHDSIPPSFTSHPHSLFLSNSLLWWQGEKVRFVSLGNQVSCSALANCVNHKNYIISKPMKRTQAVQMKYPLSKLNIRDEHHNAISHHKKLYFINALTDAQSHLLVLLVHSSSCKQYRQDDVQTLRRP